MNVKIANNIFWKNGTSTQNILSCQVQVKYDSEGGEGLIFDLDLLCWEIPIWFWTPINFVSTILSIVWSIIYI